MVLGKNVQEDNKRLQEEIDGLRAENLQLQRTLKARDVRLYEAEERYLSAHVWSFSHFV